MTTLSDALRAAITASGQSLAEIERATEVDPASLSRFMRELSSLTLGAADRIAAHLRYELRPVRRHRGN